MARTRPTTPVTVLFRPDLGPAVGMGHVARCSAIAQALDPRRAKPVLLIPSSARLPRGWGLPVWRLRADDSGPKEARETVRLLKARRPALFVADSYKFGTPYFETLQAGAPVVPVLAFDDGWKEVPEPVYGVLALGFHADTERYPADLLARSAVGSRFLPLREVVTLQRRRRARAAVRRIIVTMGSGDPEHQTSRIARVLSSIEGGWRADLILGPWHGKDPAVLKAAAADPRLRILRNPVDLPQLMAACDLAVTAGGVTSAELAFLGVPMLILATAANQVPSARRMAAQGAAIFLGDHGRATDNPIKRSILRILGDPRLRRKLSTTGRAAVDGKGAGRTARFLEETAARYHQDRYAVSTVRAEYEASSAEPEEHSRVRWGSREGMLNRFRIAEKAVDWRGVAGWLDIGCGTGAFQEEVGKRLRVRAVGMDLSPSLLTQARTRCTLPRARFLLAGLGDTIPGAPFDLVTSLGVLQKCGIPLMKAVALMAELLAPGGQLVVTTKNRDWTAFRKPGWVPEPTHHWFRLAELREAFALAGLDIVRWTGFEPRTGRTGRPESSHSVLIKALKRRPRQGQGKP
ncbi:MAG: methyltransferase domain-containing protein [Elusimicrobiota bacterium]